MDFRSVTARARRRRIVTLLSVVGTLLSGLAFLLLKRLLYCYYELCFLVNRIFASVLVADCR